MTSTPTACRRPRGCEGTFNAGLTSGHGAEANTFTVLGVSYTDKGGPGGIAPLTGRAEAILQPKTKQAEFFASTGRCRHATRARRARPQNTTDAIGGGLNLTAIEDGDYVSYKPVSLKNISALRFRVASAANTASIQVRLDSPTGPLVAETPQIAATGGAQTYKTVELPIPATAGTHELFLVFRNPGASGSLLNLNQFEFVGQGAAATAPPAVTVNAIPTTGNAPMNVVFDTTATDPDGSGPLTYAWNFGDGTRRLDAAGPDATSTRAPGTYVATLDGDRRRRRRDHGPDADHASAPSSGSCPTGFRDDFNGTDLAAGWSVLRRDQTLHGGQRPGVDPDPGRRPLPDRQHGQEHRAAPGPDRHLHDHGQDQPQGPGAVPAGRDHRLRQRRQLRQARPHGDQHAPPRPTPSSSSSSRRSTPPPRNATAGPHREPRRRRSRRTSTCGSSTTAPT